MASVAEVREELAAIFPDAAAGQCRIADSPWFEHYAAAGAFLSNKSLVMQACASLEKDIIEILAYRLAEEVTVSAASASTSSSSSSNSNSISLSDAGQAMGDLAGDARSYFAGRQNAFNDFYSRANNVRGGTEGAAFASSFPRKNTKRYSKLLDAALDREEAKCDFATSPEGRAVYAWDNVTSPAFLAALRAKQVLKDYGASAEHGEFTHRIQWYALSKEVFGSAALTSAVYASIGTWYAADRTSLQRNTVWDALCDRASNTGFKGISHDDFRSPIYFFTFLRGEGAGHYPALGAFLQSRYAKRTGAGGMLGPIVNAASLKLYKNVFGLIANSERDRVMSLRGSGVLSRADYIANYIRQDAVSESQ